MLCLLGEETEALCGFSWETLKGVHPVLMGNEVTQPPGILPHLVTPPGQLEAHSQVCHSHAYYSFCLGVSHVFPQIRIQVCYHLPQLKTICLPGLLAPLQCAVVLSIGCTLKSPERLYLLPRPALVDSDLTRLGQGLNFGHLKSFPSDCYMQPR